MTRAGKLLACTLASFAVTACKDDGLQAAKQTGRAECERFLACTLETAPTAVGPLLAVYGPDGTCWDTDSLDAVALCTEACRAGREEQGLLFPDVNTCGECTADEHCAQSPDKPYCHKATATCSACAADGHCSAGVCDPSQRACVECLDDAHCAGQLCDPDSRSCVACHDRDHCLAGTCAPDERVCVGCSADADCLTGTCDPARRTCLNCALDTDCVGAQRCVDAACVVECVPDERRCHFGADGRVTVQQCVPSGASWQLAEVCSADGRSCDAGACVVATYGRCDGPGGVCRRDGDHCVPSSASATDHYHCEPAADCTSASDCPTPMPPELASAVTCDGGVCSVQCLFGDQCPPGMQCINATCTW